LTDRLATSNLRSVFKTSAVASHQINLMDYLLTLTI